MPHKAALGGPERGAVLGDHFLILFKNVGGYKLLYKLVSFVPPKGTQKTIKEWT